MRAAFLIAVVVASLPVPCLADSEAGRKLHAQKCVACHAQKFGGDGSAIYLRPGRLVHDRAALGQRVSMCSAMINSGWFPDEEAAVAEYLAARYYKFKEAK